MHTYITDGTTYTIGFLMVQKTNGTQSFVPLFDAGSRSEAFVAVHTLNGGTQARPVDVLREYTEGATPQTKVPVGISAELPMEEESADTP